MLRQATAAAGSCGGVAEPGSRANRAVVLGPVGDWRFVVVLGGCVLVLMRRRGAGWCWLVPRGCCLGCGCGQRRVEAVDDCVERPGGCGGDVAVAFEHRDL